MMNESSLLTAYAPQYLARYLKTEDGVRITTPYFDIDVQDIELSERLYVLKFESFLLLERTKKGRYIILKIAEPGSILHHVFSRVEELRIDLGFSTQVHSQVDAIVSRPLPLKGLKDYTHLPFVTIDGEGTLDLDQAVCVKRKGENYTVYYAIADASYFVRPESPLYSEALRRGASIYFLGFSAPMLPRALSQGLVSLNPEKVRRALLFTMHVGSEGQCTQTTIERVKIRSRAKLSTHDVSNFYDAKGQHPLNNEEYADNLMALKEVALLRIKDSQKRNVVQFNRVNLDIALDASAEHFVLGLDARDKAEQYNEQISLLCNMEGAKILLKLSENDPEILAIFRNHEAPSPHHLAELKEHIACLAKEHKLNDEWLWKKDNESLADYMERIPNPGNLKNREARIRQAIERQILMMHRRSIFSSKAGLHAALAVNPYARFSAPMRELVGIFTHNELLEGLQLSSSYSDYLRNRELRAKVIQAANRSRDMQNLLTKTINSLAIASVISADYEREVSRRPMRRGTILGMKTMALYVRLDSPPIELKVYVKDIEAEFGQTFVHNASKTALISQDGSIRFTVGEAIDVRVHNFTTSNQKWAVVPIIH